MLLAMLKSAIRHILASAYYVINNTLTHFKGRVVILMYHRVLTEKELNKNFIQPGMYVRSEVFEKQILFLKEHFQILSFSELLNLWNKKDLEQNKRYCVITFDDGWLDNYIYAYPVLKKYRIPATIFLPTGFIGRNEWFWFDKLSYLLSICRTSTYIENVMELLPVKIKRGREWINSVIEALKMRDFEEIEEIINNISNRFNIRIPKERKTLNWDEVKEMSNDGIFFGSHSVSHRILTKLSDNEAKNEIKGSLNALKEKDVNYLPVFCYPNGYFNDEILKHVKEAGYLAAVSTQFGCEDNIPDDMFCLKRIGIHNDISSTIPLFVYKMFKR